MHPHDVTRWARAHLVALVGITLLTASCGGTSGSSDESAATANESEVEEPAEPSEPAEPGAPTVIDFPLIPEAHYGETDGVRHITLPTTDCANLTATPIVVGDWLVYPMHEHGNNCEGNSEFQHTLFGYNFLDGQLYQLFEGAAGEAPLAYDEGNDVLYWTTTFGGTVHILDPETFQLRRKTNFGTTSDSAGAVLDGSFYFGTVNTPGPACQDPINTGCGALVSLSSAGEIVQTLNTDDGFRAWIGTGVTSDGESLYFGSAAQTVGEKSGDETEYLYGCSVTKTDAELNVLTSFDPGELACHQLPYEGADMDSVGGEVIPDGTGLWVQYVRPNDEQLITALYRLDTGLRELCRVEFDFQPQTQAVGFYTGPTVDAAGDAYIVVSVPDEENTRRGKLLRVTPECRTTTLAEAPGSWAHATPTLADDRYVLFATDGRLQILTTSGAVEQVYTLGSGARVVTGPVIHEGVVYVVQEDATLNILKDTGLTGYGSALWPRYRHDNAGLAALRP